MGSFFPNLSNNYLGLYLIFVLHLSGTNISHGMSIDTVLDFNIKFFQHALNATPRLDFSDADTIFYIVGLK